MELTRTRSIGRAEWRWEFKPADCWVGIFVKPNDAVGSDRAHQIWICVLPMLPLHVWWRL